MRRFATTLAVLLLFDAGYALAGASATEGPRIPAPETGQDRSGAHPAVPAQVLLINQVAPRTHFYHSDVLEPWAEDVADVTEGRVQVRFSTAPLGSYRRNFDMAWSGLVDLAGGNQSSNPGRFRLVMINESPYLGTSDPESISVALWRTYTQHLAAAGEFAGTEVLALHVSSLQQLYTTVKPVREMADLQGLKIAAPSELGADLIARLGAIPVLLTAPEIHDGLSRGIIDGVSMGPTGTSRLHLYPFLKYETPVAAGAGLSWGGFYLVANRRSWQRIDAEDRRRIRAISGEAFARRAARVFIERTVDAASELRRAGIVRITPSPDFERRFRAAAAFIDEAWVEHANANGIDGATVLESFRSEVRREAGRLGRLSAAGAVSFPAAPTTLVLPANPTATVLRSIPVTPALPGTPAHPISPALSNPETTPAYRAAPAIPGIPGIPAVPADA